MTRLMVVEVTTQPAFQARSPRTLLEHEYLGAAPISNYVVSSDGRRFLVPGPVNITPAEVTSLNVVHNWFDELERLTAAAKSK
jgi:hypothetical protein